jgi:hypothetical protein
MNNSLKDPKLPCKVKPIQRLRIATKEDPIKKSQVSLSDFEKLSTLDKTLENLLKTQDPFTLNTSFTFISKDSTEQVHNFKSPDLQSLLQEFVIDPQKHRKSNFYLEFHETKQKFDLLCNKEDPLSNEIFIQRLQLYNSSIPIPDSTTRMVTFLKTLPKAQSSSNRQEILKKSRKLSEEDSRPAVFTSSLKKTISRVLVEDSAVDESLTSEDKLKVVKVLAKANGNWEKAMKKVANPNVSLLALQQFWRVFKFVMNEEVKSFSQKFKEFNSFRWIELAKKKLRMKKEKKQKSLVNRIRPKEERLDVLSFMANVENEENSGIFSEKFLTVTGTSAFREFARSEDKLRECSVNYFGVRCEC